MRQSTKTSNKYVLQKALEMLKEADFETEFFTVRGKNIGFCEHCDYCLKHKECKINDDMHKLYSILKEAKGIIIAAPVYNGGISAQTKTIMDRCRALLATDCNAFKYKVGMAIAVGGDRIGGQELAIQQITIFYILNGIIPISGGFFGANIGATFWSKDTREGVKTDEEGFRTLKKTTKKFAEFLKKGSEK